MTLLAQEALERSWYVLRVNTAWRSPSHFSSQKATWHVPPGQILVAQRGAAAVNTPAPSKDTSRPSSVREHSNASSTTASSFLSLARSSSRNGDSGITVEVALKVIPKKKVKGNEDSVWGEMEVLKGLDHKNIVRDATYHHLSLR